ncbi:MAG TPA: siderophore-interacting protein [Pedococcus sp.]|jgi:NADPH-dependent ferric siderophore reductase
MTVTSTPPVMLAFDVEVVGTRRLGPSMVRVTFGGDCLADFGDGGPLGPRDLRVKLMFAAPGHPLPDLADLSQGWYQQWLALDSSARGSMRTYTVRAARTAGPDPQIDVDFVLHDEGGHAGPGSSWAAQATVGQRLTVIGPRAGAPAYGGIEWQPPAPVDGRPVQVVLAGDETALPAIASILATLPEGYAGHALLEVPSAADVLTDVAAGGAAVEVRWLPRVGRPRGHRLREALAGVLAGTGAGEEPGVGEEPGAAAPAGARAMAPAPAPAGRVPELPEVDVDREVLWETPQHGRPEAVGATGAANGNAARDCYAWVAGEASVVRDLRRLLVHDLGLDRRQVAFMGYWREGLAERT